MKVLRFVARFFGWLLTPVVAWAASFLGATATAWAAASVGGSATRQLIATVLGGAVAAAVALIAWIHLLGRSARLRRTLNVDAEGVPLASEAP